MRMEMIWRVVLVGCLVVSLSVNVWFANTMVDDAVTADHFRSGLAGVREERDTLLAICNAALGGAGRERLLEIAVSEGVTILEKRAGGPGSEPLLLAGPIELEFSEDRLVSMSTPFSDWNEGSK